jgi:AcrR family transcriptional regulator
MAEKRRYELKERARRQEETRRRITEATMELHRTVGPARATVTEIAARAGVQRLTVYNHFPDEASLVAACNAHWLARHPPPDLADLGTVADPEQRVRIAVDRWYAYYADTEEMTANVLRDAGAVPSLAGAVEAMRAGLQALAEVLAAGFPASAEDSERRRAVAALALVLQFATWRHLVRGSGLGAADAVDVAVTLALAQISINTSSIH